MHRVFEPHQGIRVWVNKKGALIFRLHYSADPLKQDPAWIDGQRRGMDEAFYRQEFEIDFGATSGQLVYHMWDDYTLEDEFKVPAHWTRRMVVDPHPRKPFAGLWGATDPDGFTHIYREFWPSKAYNRRIRVPEDDSRISIANWVECCAWMESEENQSQNFTREKIYERVIDYAARAFKQQSANAQDAAEINYQDLIEQAADALSEKYKGFSMSFTDAKKADKGAGISLVNEAFLPLEVIKRDGTGYEKKSKIRIMRQRCPELIWQIKHNRLASQSSHQKEVADPEMKVLQVKNDLSDCLLYLVRNGLDYHEINPDSHESTWTPMYSGVGY